MVDNSVDEGRIVLGDSAFPATLQRITDLDGAQRLLVAAGQYEAQPAPLPRISGELLPPARHADTRAPLRRRRRPDFAVGTGRRRPVRRQDRRHANRVVVMFRERARTTGRSVDSPASRRPADRKWFGSAPLVGATAKVEFFAQSADPPATWASRATRSRTSRPPT